MLKVKLVSNWVKSEEKLQENIKIKVNSSSFLNWQMRNILKTYEIKFEKLSSIFLHLFSKIPQTEIVLNHRFSHPLESIRDIVQPKKNAMRFWEVHEAFAMN